MDCCWGSYWYAWCRHAALCCAGDGTAIEEQGAGDDQDSVGSNGNRDDIESKHSDSDTSNEGVQVKKVTRVSGAKVRPDGVAALGPHVI
jgi:hypothetical protein